ncbi:MAG: hypothetical protein A2V86_08375 [Deltaproteobacteria bacterium RBG_16_49_23]|nr:MAG: hypothetical protein A2V86_08375 [Deltaproteobacteria bacterium RBG_16_49_23]
MVSATREEALEMLNGYLSGKLSKEIIYQWALKIVISDEFDKLRVKDELLSGVIHALFDLHHEGEEEKFNPTADELEYYRNCLEGKIEFKK